MELPITDPQVIAGIIPQKKPFVMVDAFHAFDESSLQSSFTIPDEHIFVENGEFQASGVVEHQAQSVALHTGFGYFLKREQPPVGYIGAIKFFEISKLPQIGEVLMTDIKILSEMMGVTLVQISTKLNGEVIASSEMKTVLK